MKILFVAPYPPSRIRVRLLGFVTQLALCHEVEVLALCAERRALLDVQALQQAGISVTAIHEPRIFNWLRALATSGTQLPRQVAFAAAPRLRAVLQERLQQGHFDLLHVEMVRILGVLPPASPIPIVWDAVDCISQLYEQGSHAHATWLMRCLGRNEAQRLRAYEQTQLQRFQHVLVTSERDRQALLTLADRQSGSVPPLISVLPHGIDQHYFQPYRGEREPETLIFSGKMSFHANIAAVHHLVMRILPYIWLQRPNTRLIIAGCDPPASIRRLARDPRIEVTGYLSDLRPALARAQIALCPLPYAVGIQNKVLEAMALGTPVVASTHAAAGLPVVAGRDLLVADDPLIFARFVLLLMQDPARRQLLAEHALAYISTHHQWEHIARQLTTIYTQAIHVWQGGAYA